jgi:hypothetical protein
MFLRQHAASMPSAVKQPAQAASHRFLTKASGARRASAGAASRRDSIEAREKERERREALARRTAVPSSVHEGYAARQCVHACLVCAGRVVVTACMQRG